MNASGPPDDRLPDGESALLPDSESAAFAEAARPKRSRTLAPAPRGETPAAFGRYQVVRAIGSGGFGTVYLARDEELDRDVAIKVLKASSVSQTEIDQFLQEARRVARLRHPGIVSVHDVGVELGQPYVVSEFLSGSSLSDWLKANRPSWQEAARITAAMADALGYAHAHLTVHRDIKPANIIRTADRRPVIVDFGLSLDDTRSGGAEVGKIWGTPRYMAPEQVSGVAHRIDGRTDLYSLGVVLYEMLCGHVPFRSADLKELFRQVQHDEPQPPRQLVSDIPPALEQVCLKALSKPMQDRHTTMSDFADALRQITASALDVPSASQPVALPAPAPDRSHSSNPVTPASGGSTPSGVRRAREAERRQVTVLVGGCDLFESEAYLELETEDQASILSAYQLACRQALDAVEGTVIHCHEGGLLACLGYPTAYEDAPHRAVRAALRLLGDLTASHGALLGHSQLIMNPWVAVHTGTAIAQIDNEAVSLVGEARSVAARLTDEAKRGAVVCTEATHRLIQRQFDCDSLGHRTIKGLSHPLEIFAVRGTRASRGPFDIAAPTGLTPLTGRSHEVLLLQERWDQARQGMGQVVLITGEAGLGKSRLVYEIKRHIVDGETDTDDAAIVEWRCSPHFENTGLYPAIGFYERLLNFSADDTPAERHQRLLSHLEEYGLARSELLPLFASLLSVPHTETFPALGLSPVRAREETLRAIGEWLRAYASRRPILLVVEDLQWADASTLEFLGEFVGEGLHDCMLSLFTFRSEFRPPWPAGDHQTSLALTRLTRRQVEEMIRGVVADPTVAAALTTRLHDRTGGVPLFVEEFVKVLQPVVAGDSAGATGLAAGEIPATLQDLVMARLDRIDGDRAVVQLAATLGREFRYEMIAAVAAMDDFTLQEELQKLVQAEILYQKGKPPGAHYTFKHALLENAAYNSMLKPKRQEFHQRIAETLVTRFQTAETHPELVALHFTEAGLTRKGADYWLSAGVKARQRSAEYEAINHLTKGLSLLDGLEATPDRDQQILRFLGALAPAYIAIRGYAAPEVGPILSRARALCEQLGEPVQLFAIMLGTWEWRLVRGDIGLAAQLASEGMALAERMNDPGVFMEALFMPGVTLFYRGEFARSRAHHEQALAAYDDRERTREWSVHTGHNAGVTHRCYLAQILWYLGYPDQAIKMDDETRALAATIAHPFSLAHAVDHTALLYLHLGLGTDALAAAEEEIRIATDQGFPLWHSLGLLHKGGALTLQGKAEEGLSLLLKGFADFRATGSELRVPYYHGLFCEAYLQLGRFPEARVAVDEGLRIAEQNDDRFQEAELHRLKGELMLCGSRDEVAAEACFQSALGVARRQQSTSWELRATVSLATLWAGQGRQSDAGQALSIVYSSFTEGWTTPDLLDARALLDHLGH